MYISGESNTLSPPYHYYSDSIYLIRYDGMYATVKRFEFFLCSSNSSSLCRLESALTQPSIRTFVCVSECLGLCVHAKLNVISFDLVVLTFETCDCYWVNSPIYGKFQINNDQASEFLWMCFNKIVQILRIFIKKNNAIKLFLRSIKQYWELQQPSIAFILISNCLIQSCTFSRFLWNQTTIFKI